MIRRHSAKSTSSQAVNGTMAALLTRMSIWPLRLITSACRAATAASSPTSTPTA